MVAFTDAGSDRPVCTSEKFSSGEALNSSALSAENPSDIDPPARARYSVAQVKDSMREALDSIVQSGTTDQMRGYANQAMGKTKLTLGMATQSPSLALAGLAQIVVGEFQKSIGEAKLAEGGEDIFREL